MEDLQIGRIHPYKLPVFASDARFLRPDQHGEDLSVSVILKKAYFVKGIDQAEGPEFILLCIPLKLKLSMLSHSFLLLQEYNLCCM